MSIIENKEQRRALIDPIMLALKSRRVLVAMVALIVGFGMLLVPELEAVRDEVTVLLTALALAVIGGYSIEDAARAGREKAAEPVDPDVKVLVREAIEATLDELGLKRVGPPADKTETPAPDNGAAPAPVPEPETPDGGDGAG